MMLQSVTESGEGHRRRVRICYFDNWARQLEGAVEYVARAPSMDLTPFVAKPKDPKLSTWHEVVLDVPENPNGAHSIELETRGLPENDFRWALWRNPRFAIGATAHHGGVNMHSLR